MVLIRSIFDMPPTRRPRRKGYTRLTSRGQVTIPQATLAEAGLHVGDELKIDIAQGKIVLSPTLSLGERRRAAIQATAGAFPGVWEPGDLDRLRDEWR